MKPEIPASLKLKEPSYLKSSIGIQKNFNNEEGLYSSNH
jgi:hypothetical protein